MRGEVQALLEIGGGLHPEFTGRENIQASLAYLGLSADEIRAAENDIAEFTELGRFLEQPFKTYSQGMQARLSFGIATTVQPEILIVDEILGAGDAYFFTRSTSRMRQLIDGGATVLLVSHALDQIVRFCDEAIWLDRGRIVMRGESTEVVKTYERFVRELEDKRLLAANRKARTGRFDAFERESYSDQVHVELRAPPVRATFASSRCTATARSRTRSRWEMRRMPIRRSRPRLRQTQPGRGRDAKATRSTGRSRTGRRSRSSTSGSSTRGPVRGRDRVPLAGGDGRSRRPPSRRRGRGRRPAGGRGLDDAARTGSRRRGRGHADGAGRATPDGQPLARRGIADDRGGRPARRRGQRAGGLPAGIAMTLHVRVRAGRNGSFPVTPAATMYRADGILVSNHVGASIELEFDPGATQDLRLDFGPLALGDGRYLFSIALYRALSALDGEPYDLIDRSYEFEVTGNGAFDNGVVRLPAAWSVVESRVGADAPAG